MANGNLQLASAPVLPVAHRIRQPEDTYTDSVNKFNTLLDVPVKQAQRKADMAESKLRFQQASGAAKRESNFNALMPDDADDLDLALTQYYVKEFGRPPVDPTTGKIDKAKVSDRVAKAQEARRRMEESAAAAKGNETKYYTIDDEKGVPQLWREVIDASGNSVSKKLLGPDSTAIAHRRATASQSKAATEQSQELINLKDALSQVKEAKELTKPGAKDVVGPVAGNVVTQFGQQVRSAFGSMGAQDVLNRQAKLRFLVSDLVLNNVSKLKGPLSDKDIAFLKAGVPKPTDDNAVWQEYLTRFEKLLIERQSALGGAAPAGTTAPAESSTTPAQTPAAANTIEPSDKIFAHTGDPTKVWIRKPDGTQFEATREEAIAARSGQAAPAPAASAPATTSLADVKVSPAPKPRLTDNPNIAKSRLTLQDVQRMGLPPGQHEIDGVIYEVLPDGTVKLVG